MAFWKLASQYLPSFDAAVLCWHLGKIELPWNVASADGPGQVPESASVPASHGALKRVPSSPGGVLPPPFQHSHRAFPLVSGWSAGCRHSSAGCSGESLKASYLGLQQMLTVFRELRARC